MSNPAGPSFQLLIQHLSADRLSTYLQHCNNDLSAAIGLYEWNTSISAALWETLGHTEVVLRNTVADRLTQRHTRLSRPNSWLDDPARELDGRAINDIADARDRLRSKGKPASEGQIISELSFGFWRFLIARRYQTTLWPAIAGGFRHAPGRAIRTVEGPVSRLHEFRNRLAHHQRVWNMDLPARYTDMLDVLGFVDPDVRTWAEQTSRVSVVLAARPSGN
jgi:hypothetical protein